MVLGAMKIFIKLAPAEESVGRIGAPDQNRRDNQLLEQALADARRANQDQQLSRAVLVRMQHSIPGAVQPNNWIGTHSFQRARSATDRLRNNVHD